MENCGNAILHGRFHLILTARGTAYRVTVCRRIAAAMRDGKRTHCEPLFARSMQQRHTAVACAPQTRGGFTGATSLNPRFPFEDVDLVCADCGEIFLWNGKAQQRCFEEQRQPPRRCRICRQTRRNGLQVVREPFSNERSFAEPPCRCGAARSRIVHHIMRVLTTR